VNYVNEIPLGYVLRLYWFVLIDYSSTAKMEISTDEENNPIKQDIKKGNLRLGIFQLFYFIILSE
jgi:hypothetical protein